MVQQRAPVTGKRTPATGKRAAARPVVSRADAAGAAPPRSLSEKIYTRIKQDILACVLAPGEACTESQLANAYGVSKAPVRWALAALSRERLVSAKPRHGYTVAPVTIEAVNDLFGLRLILEPAAARLAAGRADIALLKAIDARIATGVKAGDRRSEQRWIEVNNAFHIEITRGAGNDRLTRLVTTVLEECQRTMHIFISALDRARAMADDHRNLVAALARNDAKAAERFAREHLEHSRQAVMDALLDNATVRRTNLVDHRARARRRA